jgi:hypothetical protein
MTASLWWTWFGTVTAAEVVGFAVPLAVGAFTADAGPAVAVPALLGAGAIEGAVLGAGQATVLVRVLPRFPAVAWVVATAAGAVSCYALGLLPSLAAGAWASWPPTLVAVLGVLLGVALLGVMGTAQWWVLRHHVARAWRWIAATAVAWLAGLGAFLGLAMPFWQPAQPTELVLVIGLAAAVVMAAVVAAVTGVALVRLLATRPGRAQRRSLSSTGRAPGPLVPPGPARRSLPPVPAARPRSGGGRRRDVPALPQERWTMLVELTEPQVGEVSMFLARHLGDLSAEIAATDNPAYRRRLVERRDLLRGVLAALSQRTPSTPHGGEVPV